MRLILLFSALLAALTGVGTSARAGDMRPVEQQASVAAETAVAVVLTLAAHEPVATVAGKAAMLAPQVLGPGRELFQDRPLE